MALTRIGHENGNDNDSGDTPVTTSITLAPTQCL